jgi:peptidoglycan hydrolase-like protein with peptidoglycan-binding domain
LTKTAVQAYQTKHGLSPLGIVGPVTRKPGTILLNRLLNEEDVMAKFLRSF